MRRIQVNVISTEHTQAILDVPEDIARGTKEDLENWALDRTLEEGEVTFDTHQIALCKIEESGQDRP